MFLSDRESTILNVLLNSRNRYTIQELSKKLKITERTLYREMRNVKETLKKFNLELVSIPTEGFEIKGTSENISALENELKKIDIHQIISVTERVDLVTLILLLEDDFIKMQSIASILSVSLSTIKSDINFLTENLSEKEIKLYSKKGMGIKVESNSVNKHILILDIITKYVSSSEFIGWYILKNSRNTTIKEIVQQKIGENLEFSYNLVMKLRLELDDENLQELIILLSLWLRATQQQNITNFYFKDIFISLNKTGNLLYKKIIESSQEVLNNIEITDNYLDYLKWIIHLYYQNNEDYNITTKKEDSDINTMTKKLVKNVENQLGIRLSGNDAQITDLTTHLKKAVTRINSGLYVRNPMKNEIKKNYKYVFEIVVEAAEEVFGKSFFPEDELCFVVLYFIMMIDKLSNKAFRVLIVCSSGMGSSKMLTSRLEYEVPEVYVKDVISLTDLKNKTLSDYELVLSTVPLPIDDDEYLQVTPLLNQEELVLVQNKINNHKYTDLKIIQKNEVMDAELFISHTKRKMLYSEKILNIFKNLTFNSNIVNNLEIETKQEILQKAVDLSSTQIEITKQSVERIKQHKQICVDFVKLENLNLREEKLKVISKISKSRGKYYLVIIESKDCQNLYYKDFFNRIKNIFFDNLNSLGKVKNVYDLKEYLVKMKDIID